jgi:hypothetical protein
MPHGPTPPGIPAQAECKSCSWHYYARHTPCRNAETLDYKRTRIQARAAEAKLCQARQARKSDRSGNGPRSGEISGRL